MKSDEDIRPITYLKSSAADLLKQVNETRRPVVITQNGEARAVLQDPESYEHMRSAIGMLKLIPQGEEEVRRRWTTGQADVFARLEKKPAAKKGTDAPARNYRVEWTEVAAGDLEDLLLDRPTR